MNDRQKQGIALVLTGTVLAALAIHPPKVLTAVYLAFERAVVACAGVLLEWDAFSGLAWFEERRAPAGND